MGTYIPASLIPVTSLGSTTTAGGTYSAPSGTTGIVRTLQFSSTNANAFTASLGADAAGTRIFQDEAITGNVAVTKNGWWVTPSNSATAIQMKVSHVSFPTNGQCSGYTYS